MGTFHTIPQRASLKLSNFQKDDEWDRVNDELHLAVRKRLARLEFSIFNVKTSAAVLYVLYEELVTKGYSVKVRVLENDNGTRDVCFFFDMIKKQTKNNIGFTRYKNGVLIEKDSYDEPTL